jgi:hypothetical protein
MVNRHACEINTAPTPFRRVHVRVMNSSPRFVLAMALAFSTAGLVAAKPGNGNGKGKGQSGDFVPPGLVDKGGVPPGHRRAPEEIIVKLAPPAFRVEAIPARPSAGHVWVSGYWRWDNNAYAWAPGVWMAPPEPAAVWVAPRYEARSGVHVMITGYWKL